MHRALLVLLALDAGKVVPVDRLLEDLWAGRPPEFGRNCLQNCVHQLRRALGADTILWRSPGYLLDVPPEQIDAGRFQLGVAAARAAADDERRAKLLHKALGLWRG